MTTHSIEELDIYHRSIELADKIWHLVIEWRNFSKDTIGSQIIRASDSIAANISTGYGRFFYRDNRLYCYIARGSLYETKTYLIKARNRELVTIQDFAIVHSEVEGLIDKLNAHIKHIELQLKNF